MAGKRERCLFRETEVARLLRAGERAGVRVRVDIGKDGGYSVIPMEPEPQQDIKPSKTSPELQSWD